MQTVDYSITTIHPHGKKRVPKGNLRRSIRRYRILYLMTLPAIAFALVFNYYPLWGYAIAFTDYKVYKGIFDSDFVGFKHFARLFSSYSGWGDVIKNTVCINIMSMILLFSFSIAFALVLSEFALKRLSRVVQMTSLFSYFMSWIIAYSLCYALFSINSGAINELLVSLGILKKGLNILGSTRYAWTLMVGLNVWKSFGYYSIIFLSTLVSVSEDELEAASIDGANRWQRVIHIKFPHLKNVFFMMMILECGQLFNGALDQYYAFTNAQNWDKMITFGMYIYNRGLAKGDYPFGQAASIVLMLLSLGLTLLINKLSKVFADTYIV